MGLFILVPTKGETNYVIVKMGNCERRDVGCCREEKGKPTLCSETVTRAQHIFPGICDHNSAAQRSHFGIFPEN